MRWDSCGGQPFAVAPLGLPSRHDEIIESKQASNARLYPKSHTHSLPTHPPHAHPYHHHHDSIVMAFVRTAARQMGHGLERVDVSLSLRKWWKLGYTRQNGLVRS